MIERITHLTAPPVVGRRYLVPTVTYPWLDIDRPFPWPVFLPLHDDGQFFNFPHDHYHVDPRFLNKRQWSSVVRWGDYRGHSGLGICQGFPLAWLKGGLVTSLPHPAIVWSVRQCQLADAPYVHGHIKAVGKLRESYAGQTCKKARAGWVCPHQNWPMGSLEPDADGVITCPLHGLRVRAADGVVL